MRKLPLIGVTAGGLAVIVLATVVPALAGGGALPADVREVRFAVARYTTS